ncbi:hypothetical protein OXX59_008738 [Metschnikowia pulcherrima]
MPKISSYEQSLLQTLSFGCFPRNVSDLQHSESYLSRIAFVDFELLSALQPVSAQALRCVPSKSKVDQLINDICSVNLEYSRSEKSYLEVYYGSVVLAHLQILRKDEQSAIETLNGFRIEHNTVFHTHAEQEFMDYISARFHGLLGDASENSSDVWVIFLKSLKHYGRASQVSANIWIDYILDGLISKLSLSGQKPLHFKLLENLGFAKNRASLIAIANHCLKSHNQVYTHEKFESEYVTFLHGMIREHIKQRKEFPNANENTSEETDFVQTLYQTLNNLSPRRSRVFEIVSPQLTKEFLVSMAGKSYQSQSVLSNLIRSLIDLGEYDEALAASKTYTTYVDKERIQEGYVSDLLEVIDMYSLCILNFNPMNSSIPDSTRPTKRFKYNSIDLVVQELSMLAKALLSYLDQAETIAHVTYGDNVQKKNAEKLSFLYCKFNATLLLDKKMSLIGILSEAWHALGELYRYHCTFSSPTLEALENNKKRMSSSYRNCLILNSSDNLTHLFRYSLMLANESYVDESIKLCKFTLKKYPESFKTWNLLVLLQTALECENRARSAEVSSQQLNDTLASTSSLADQTDKVSKKFESEKFIEDALNIATLHLTGCQNARVYIPIQTKYQILQLKMTQLAVWETTRGVEAVLEHIADVFLLFRELFSHVQFPQAKKVEAAGFRAEAIWFKRPSVMDISERENSSGPKPTNGNKGGERHDRKNGLSLDSTRRLKSSEWVGNTNQLTSNSELKILQDVWLWTASIYLKLGFLKEAEQCLVEAETIDIPNVKTYTYLGLLTSQSREHLALQEYERSLELFHSTGAKYNMGAYGLTLLGLSQLFMRSEDATSPLFVSEKDRDAGLARLKNYLEGYSACWPHGHNSSEVWYYLSALYERFDDKILQSKALWKCVSLESSRPVRSYNICEDFDS